MIGLLEPVPTLAASHNDWLGSERVRTDINGAVWESCTDSPYGDALNCGAAPYDASPYHFAGMYRDDETGFYHTLNRYYNPRLGSWMSPDPAGLAAADLSNPQSLNRYAYVLNNPINFVDPFGLDMCALDGRSADGCAIPCDDPFVTPDPETCSGGGGGFPFPIPVGGGGGGGGGISGGGPNPATGKPSPPLSEQLPPGVVIRPPGLWTLFLPIDEGCEFGACVPLGDSFGPGNPMRAGGPIIFSLSAFCQLFHSLCGDPYPIRFFGTHWCGPGGAGPNVNSLDTACHAHDVCYDNNGLSISDNFFPSNPAQLHKLQQCNQALCDAARQTSDPGAGRVQWFFSDYPAAKCR